LAPLLWSNEKKKELFGHANQCFVWRRKKDACRKEHPTVSTVKHGYLMLWGCFASPALAALVKVNGIMNFIKCQDILAKNLKPGRKGIFLQDHDLKHTQNPQKNG
jgi:hypothetical protein